MKLYIYINILYIGTNIYWIAPGNCRIWVCNVCIIFWYTAGSPAQFPQDNRPCKRESDFAAFHRPCDSTCGGLLGIVSLGEFGSSGCGALRINRIPSWLEIWGLRFPVYVVCTVGWFRTPPGQFILSTTFDGDQESWKQHSERYTDILLSRF